MSAIFVIPAIAAMVSVLLIVVGYRLRAAGMRTLRRGHRPGENGTTSYVLGTALILGGGLAAVVAVLSWNDVSKLVGNP